jgi:hypothetical protein
MGLNHEGIRYDPEALVQPIRMIRNLEQHAGHSADPKRYASGYVRAKDLDIDQAKALLGQFLPFPVKAEPVVVHPECMGLFAVAEDSGIAAGLAIDPGFQIDEAQAFAGKFLPFVRRAPQSSPTHSAWPPLPARNTPAKRRVLPIT